MHLDTNNLYGYGTTNLFQQVNLSGWILQNLTYKNRVITVPEE